MACGSEVMALWEIGLEKKARRLLKNAQQQKQIMSLFLLMEIRRKKKVFTTGVCGWLGLWQYFIKDLKDYPSEQTRNGFFPLIAQWHNTPFQNTNMLRIVEGTPAILKRRKQSQRQHKLRASSCVLKYRPRR